MAFPSISVTQWIEHSPGVNLVTDSRFFFVPHLWHAVIYQSYSSPSFFISKRFQQNACSQSTKDCPFNYAGHSKENTVLCGFYQDKGHCLLFRGVSALIRCLWIGVPLFLPRQDVHLAILNLLSFSINNNSVQERALCAAYKSQTESYKELLTCAKLPMLYNRCLQDIAILMYKVKYGMAPRCVSELFTIKSTQQRLRNCDFELPRFDTAAYGRHSLHNQKPFICSKVSSELRNLTSFKAFKKHIWGVDLLSHIDNNSNCCNLCKFWVVDICT